MQVYKKQSVYIASQYDSRQSDLTCPIFFLFHLGTFEYTHNTQNYSANTMKFTSAFFVLGLAATSVSALAVPASGGMSSLRLFVLSWSQ